MVVGEARLYDISTTDGVWPNPDQLGLLALSGVWLLPALALTVVEAICVVAYPTPWPARCVGIVATILCGLAGLMPVGLRLAGDESPAQLADVTLSVLLVGALVTGQIEVGATLCRVFLRRALERQTPLR